MIYRPSVIHPVGISKGEKVMDHQNSDQKTQMRRGVLTRSNYS